MPKNNVEKIYALTPLQQGMLFHSLYSPESTFYNLHGNFVAQGEVDLDALKQAWAYLIERHAVLRTAFVWEDIEKPYQVVNKQVAIDIVYHDLSGLPEKEREQRTRSLIEAEENHRFNLKKPPLARLLLVTLDNSLHHLVWTYHHIILEGWSTSLLMREFWELYEAFQLQRPADLPPVQPYAKYISWLKRQDQDKAEAYWRERLSDFNTPTHLPFDKTSATEMVNVVKSDMQQLVLPPELNQALQKMAQKNQLTMNTVVMGLWGILLSIYCGEESVVFGTAVSGRPSDLPGADAIVGLFVSTLPVRVYVNVGEQLVPWLQSLQLDLAKMRQFEYSSLMQVKKWSGVAGGQSLFNTLVGFENWASEFSSGESLSKLKVSSHGHHRQSDQPLTLFATFAESSRLSLMYDVARFDGADIERMLQHCRNLLEDMAANPGKTLSQLSMLSEKEQRQFVDWNQTSTDYPRDKTIQELFEQQAAATPDATALEYEGSELDYARLNTQANQLAHYLRAKGVGAEVRVGVFMERSLEMIVALLGIIKAGGAYVPIDLDYPQPRISFMLEDAAVPVLLTTSSLKEQLPGITGELVCVDSDRGEIEKQQTDNPAPCTTADSLAYVIYTSGSTGEPKGVEIQHAGLTNLVSWHTRAYDVSSADRATHLAGLGFDASVWELWPYLTSGASLYLVSDEQRLAPASLLSWMASRGITLTFLPTPLAEVVLREAIPDDLKLRVLLTGGDRLHAGLVEKKLPFRVVNHYGPTENAVVSTCIEVDVSSTEEPPIGRPIDNVQTYILGKELQLVPVGVSGELYIAGESLARGYLNQPELTAEKFVPNPFSEDPGARLYATGDQVRHRVDGAIEFIGRIDQQVKLRGFRVELGEIESLLLRQQLVSEAVVIVHEIEPSDKRLLAYVVAVSDDAPSEADLRDLVAENLPNYMVPAAFIILDKLPLTANGKLDRQALPLPQDMRASLEVEYMPPRTELEQQLAQIWAEVLKLERPGIHDNFFDLGGHSLMATQVVSRVRKQFNVELPLSDLFGCPTVASLGPIIESLQAGRADDQALVIAPAARDRDLPLSFAQERLWFLDQLQPGNPAYIIPMALRLKGGLDVSALLKTLNAIVQRHEALRTRFVNREGGAVQVIDEEVGFNLRQIDLSGLPVEARDQELMLKTQAEALQPFDLSSDQLVRGVLLRLGEQDHVLLLSLHHIISDGWSMGVLFREMGEYYAAFCSDRLPQLPELPIQYADFAAWQRDWLSGEQLDRQLGYWRRQLDDVNTLDLPTDFPRPPMQTYAGAAMSISLQRRLSTRLESYSKQSGVTLFMTLLGAYALMMQRYSGQDDVVIGAPIANRNRAELEDLIAFFVNMLVMRVDCSGNPDFGELMRRVSATVLAAYEHQDIPFEKLVDDFNVERDPSRNPLFQATFTLQNAPLEKLDLTDLTLEFIGNKIQVTRFDLECHCWQSERGIDVVFIYNTDLFEAATIERMMSHYHHLLESVAADPDQAIDFLPMLGQDETSLLLEQWNQTRRDYPQDVNLMQLFGAQLERSPAAIALEFDGEVLSFSELDARSNQLARYLQTLDVGAEVLVGVYLERSLEMVVGILGILKAGGAYVPLDPEYPLGRLTFMLEDTRLPVLLTGEGLREALPDTEAQLVCLDSGWATIDEYDDSDLSVEIDPDQLAYVLYTSGSTGRPKGVAVAHRSVCNHMLWMQETFPLGETDKVLQKTPFSFDASVWEFFAPLIAGARLVMAQAQAHKDPRYLAAAIVEHRITRIQLVPSLLKVMLDEGLLEGCTSLRHVFCGGEALTVELQQRFFACHGGELCNLYGPTEATIDATWWQCDRHSQLRSVPIGRPISNNQVYLLDRHRQPVPVGVTGEIHIGGAGLARGYLNRAELTEERFIAHPFSDRPEARLYRSGDLGRYLPDGNIEYLGRSDHQVKLRGVRIELGEIEGALAGHAALRDAVTIVREDEPGNKRLAAYVVPAHEWIEQQSSSYSSEHVSEWQLLYEETYGNVDAELDLTTDFTGWTSSYTGEPVALNEMNEWLDSTIARITSLQPKRALEIGCGSGLLLYRLAPGCERYVGADFSAAAQQQVNDLVSAEAGLGHVELWHRSADDFSGIGAGDFDTVVINSVVQYFPSLDYLLQVITAAVEAISTGGRVFVGDVRSFALLNAYHASVDAYRSPDKITGSELLRGIQQHMEEENELVIEPAFFHVLKQRIARISDVEILLKHGQYTNELSAFRYDVILHVEAGGQALADNGHWVDWGRSGYSENQLEEMLRQANRSWLGINAIPNRRVAGDIALLDQLQGTGLLSPVSELQRNAKAMVQQAIDPAMLWRVAAECGCELELKYTGSGADGHMDALFRRDTRADCVGKVFWPQQERVAKRNLNDFASNPLKGKLGRELVPQLKDDLRELMPEYMVPSVFVVLDAMPLTANGKVDRQALPVPGDVRIGMGVDYVAARNEVEQQLAQIWQEVLNVSKVGIHDNFFDLGGHSLMATQVVSRVRKNMNVELPLAEMFAYTSVAELAPIIESLGSESGDDELRVISLAERDGELPLSFAQQRLWFLDQLEPGGSAYNVPGAIKLKGVLDIKALHRSLQEIIDRHEVLRTSFAQQDGRAVQKIAKEFKLDLLVEDFSAVAEPERSAELQQVLSEEAIQPFDLASGPVIRCRLIRLTDEEHILLLTMHHIASDGWSVNVFIQELGALYDAFCREQSSPLSPLPVQYADFAVWQRQRLAGEVLQAQVDYWKNQLEGVSNLQLPTDRPRPRVQTYCGTHASIMLDKDLTGRWEEIYKQQAVTPFMALLAAFSVLLKRYSGQDEIVVGTPIANRNHREIEDLIGFFVNTLVFRTDVSANPTFVELLGRVRDYAIGAYEHQDLPFETIVDELKLERDRSRNPLFQVLFAVQNLPSQAFSLKGLTLEPVPLEQETTRFDLEIHIWQGPENLYLNFTYNTDLFNADTIERMLAHFQALLVQIAANPACRVDDLELLTRNEYQQLVDRWNQTESKFLAQTQTVHEMFEAQVERSPDAAALESAGQTLSYRELNNRANRLAHYLREQGVGPDRVVGICLQRGFEAAQAVLAVLKAGGGYTPLDPAYPDERLRFMLTESKCAVLLTQSDLAQRLPSGDTPVVCLDETVPWLDFSEQNPRHQTQTDNLAYVIFTSGSTGRPKGVVMAHSVLCNLIQWQLQRSGDIGSGRTLQFSALSFDVSFQEMFATWCAGGTLVLVDEELRRDPVQLLEFLHQAKINRLFMPFAGLNQLTEVAQSCERIPGSLQEIITAGEALQVTPAMEYLFEQLEDCTLDNQYGPTETHVVTAGRLRGNPGEWPRLPSIGKPIANAKIFLLDDRMRPVPIGVPGNLYIGGECLARGYFGRADLTDEKFVADPFSEESDARLYYTGDLTRYLANGDLEYLGRADGQVKLRGYRIELGEIEAVLMEHAGVQACVTMVREDQPGNRRLVGYYVGSDLVQQDLRAGMKKRLPEYMVPSILMELESLPLTPSGKVDRGALPVPDGERQTGEEYVEPRTETEQQLVNIWQQVLDVNRIGVYDNFFELGGHSLMITRVASRISDSMKLDLSIANLFEYTTVAELAEYIDTKQWAKQSRKAGRSDLDAQRQVGEL